MAMAATQRNSMRADSFAVGFHASEWLLSQGQWEGNETVLVNPSNPMSGGHEKKKG